jgi:hypothetical protein
MSTDQIQDLGPNAQLWDEIDGLRKVLANVRRLARGDGDFDVLCSRIADLCDCVLANLQPWQVSRNESLSSRGRSGSRAA